MHGCVTMICVCRGIHVHVSSILMDVIDLSLTTNLDRSSIIIKSQIKGLIFCKGFKFEFSDSLASNKTLSLFII